MIQALMPQLSSASFWTRLLAHCFKTTICRSEIVSSQCHQHDFYQRNNALTWIFLLQLEYSLGSTPQRTYKTLSSHTTGTCFHWWQYVMGRNPTSSLNAPPNIQIYGMIAPGAWAGASRSSSIIATSPTGCQCVKYLRPTLSGKLVPGIFERRPTSAQSNPPTKVHNFLRAAWHISTTIYSHSWRGLLQHLWPPLSHIVLAIWSCW